MVDWLAKFLKGGYCKTRLRKRKEENDTWPPIKIKSFVTLALMHQRDLQTRADTTQTIFLRAKGDISDIPKNIDSKKLTDITQIFSSQSDSVLIEGHPGIGKTTLVKEICVQWAEGKLLTSDKLVLLLLLRDPNVQRITNVQQLIEHFTQSTSKVTQLHSYLEDNHGADVTLIIDGFDELSNKLRKKSFFIKLIGKNILPEARIVVTSRPTASVCLHDVVDRRIEILGFDQISRMEYASEALQGTPSKLEKLQIHFRQYPNIDAICYLPLIMSIIVFLCMCQPEDLPPTASKMYHSFVLHTICHYLKRTEKIDEDEHINKMEHLPQLVQQVLQQVQKVAFDGLVEDKIVFTMDDLPDMCRDDPTCYGLLQSVECYCSYEIGTPTKSFNFLHLGIQEYFAAKYVATLPEDEVYTLLKESFPVKRKEVDGKYTLLKENNKSVRHSNMWIMYCGITGGQCRSLRCYLSTSKSPEEVVGLPRISWPSPKHQTSTKSHLSRSRKYMISDRSSHYRKIPKPSIHPSLSQKVTHDVQSRHIHVSHPKYNTSLKLPPLQNKMKATLLQQGYHPVSSHHDPSNSEHVTTTKVTSGKMTVPSQQRSTSEQEISNALTISHEILEDPVKVLYLFQCFQEAQDDKLCDILSKSFDSGEINLSLYKLLPHQVVSLGFFLSRSHRKWKELRLDCCNIGDHDINLLHHYLCGDKTNKQEITTIDLSRNNLTGASSPLIGDIITHLQPHTLMLDQNNITNVRDISTTVINTNTVKVLHMRDNDLTSQEASAISDMMTCLEELNISFNKLGDDGAVIISKGITKTNTLRVMDISDNNITSTGAIAISNSLLHNTSLEVLDMRYKAIGQDGAKAIAQVITNNKTLKKLYINNCEITDTGATAIANSLLHNTSLEELDMSYNAIGQDGAKAIAQAITNNKTLKKLNINNCEITDTGATAIANSLLHNTSLEELVMSYNAIGQDGAKAIAQAITNNKTLKELNINNCEITDTGATAIANSLLHNTSLEVLHMSYNAIGQDETTAIAQAITNNKTLKELYLYGDVTIDEQSAMIIMRSLHHNNSITKLKLPKTLKNNDNVKREVEHINSTRRKCNIQELVHHGQLDIINDY